jgi:hypothetical protein
MELIDMPNLDLALSRTQGTLIESALLVIAEGTRGSKHAVNGCCVGDFKKLLEPQVRGSSRFVGKCIPEMSVMPPSGRHFSRE